MTYNGRKVFTQDDFDYGAARPGDYVEDAVVDEAMNTLPPAGMRSDCSQLGEPYSHQEDPDTGKWRATYATFKRITHGIWEYCGHCFMGENRERGREVESHG